MEIDCNYIDGKKCGLYREWYDNGNLFMEIDYFYDLHDGLFKMYGYDGSLISSWHFNQNTREGEQIRFSEHL